MQKTSIEWTGSLRPDDGTMVPGFTANPLKYRDKDGKAVWGCVKVSPGCTHCYAEALANRYGRGGPFKQSVMDGLTPFLDEKELHSMLTHKPASGRRCFIGDMTDIFGAWVPDELLDRLFATMAVRNDVTWQVLTKRAERMREYMDRVAAEGQTKCWGRFDDVAGWTTETSFPLPNVWLGVSVEDQQRADERIPQLLQTPAAVRFLSVEPLLGPVDLSKWLKKPLQIAQHDRCRFALDNQVREKGTQDGDTVASSSDFPSGDGLPSSLYSGMVPADRAADGGDQPLDQRAVSGVDRKPGAVGPASAPSPVKISLTVEQASDVGDHRHVTGNANRLRKDGGASSPQRGSGGSEATQNSGSRGVVSRRDLADSVAATVGGDNALQGQCDSLHDPHCISWVIVGGESGPGARPCETNWLRSIVRQCDAAGVPCFVKQLGSRPVCQSELDTAEFRRTMKDRKGGDITEFPADLRVREFPQAAVRT